MLAPIMPIDSIEEFAKAIPRQGRLLGLDLGSKTIGLALSDLGRRISSPLETIKRQKFKADAQRLAALCEHHGVVGLVIGLPVNMDGSEGSRCQSTRQFAENLETLVGFALPIAFWDERLSTAAVERFLVEEADLSRRRRSQLVDKMAAAYILQGALEALAASGQQRH